MGISGDSPALFSLIPESPAEPSVQGTKSSKSRLDKSLQSNPRHTLCHSRSSGLGSPLLSHNFDQPTARSLPFSVHTGIVPRGRMQQLLINGLNPVICPKKMYVFLISQGSTLRSPGGSYKVSATNSDK